MLSEHLIAKTKPHPNPKCTVILNNIRITVIAPELIRVEKNEKGRFEDRATQIVWFRDLGENDYAYKQKDEKITVTTEKAVFVIDTITGKAISVTFDGNTVMPNENNNLLGTARTLDKCSGKIDLEKGVISKDGVSSFTDDSLILDIDGMVHQREKESDVYYFASNDYLRILKLFYSITGEFPMVPRYALGNWWSRFHKYTQKEYLDLMKRFDESDIPFTVATIDMDWHLVFVGFKYGCFNTKSGLYSSPLPGWTGYTWNEKLFPDYKGFLRELKQLNLHTTLNTHPALGVRYYEKQYKEMCNAMGLNPKKRKTIEFDVTNENFLNAYFSILHKPYENEGVDFWWIDWQQGKKTKIEGYDPLWACNHYHYLDLAKDGKRPLVLSRYAGIGSHRYPIGFSGDTYINWEVLNMIPYFTATSANIGYTSWSHDIGGHMHGNPKDDEIYLRWIQFGVFSPFNRLHSTNNSTGKEPWNHKSVETLAIEQLRLRHRLIPYIYTAFYKNYKDCIPLLMPLYYIHKEEQAYTYKNEYYFGSELIVVPITTKINSNGKASVKIWLPDGEYTDIFTGEKLNGGEHVVERDLTSIPVFAKKGAVIPMSLSRKNDYSNPSNMEILVFKGNNTYTLYEDDGESEAYKSGEAWFTKFVVSEKSGGILINVVGKGHDELIPSTRCFTFRFPESNCLQSVDAIINGTPVFPIINDNTVTISFESTSELSLSIDL